VAVATTDRLPLNLWRAMNHMCRGVTGAGSRPAAAFIQYGHITPAEVVVLRELGLLQVTADGDDLPLAGLSEWQLRRLLVQPATRLRVTAAGNRWVGENPWNLALRAVARIDNGDGACLRRVDAATAGLVDPADWHALADAGLIVMLDQWGGQVPSGRFIARTRQVFRARLTTKARNIIAA
jgi:hypothetical protein